MPSSTFESQQAWSYQEADELPLPGPALVIDTRQFENPLDLDPMALLVYLWGEMYDIARAMRRQHVESWGHVHTFLGFRKLNTAGADDYLVHDPRSWKPGKMAEHYTAAQLTIQLGRLMNELRNQRIARARPSDPSQATVRVIFLVDLADQESEMHGVQAHMAGQSREHERHGSFGLAIRCAGLLKAWAAHEQGLPSDRHGVQELQQPRSPSHAMLETVAICLNTRTSAHYHLLTHIATATALDTLILVQPYRQDYGYLDLQAQVSHAEIILSALLLHWPQAMLPGIEDAPDLRQAAPAHNLLPRPVYILGAAAIEHASRWGERWWSYGLATILLEQLLDSEIVEKQDTRLQRRVHEWWANWRTHVRRTLEGLGESLTQLAGLHTLQRLCQSALFQAHSISDLRQQAEAFMASLRPLYHEARPGSFRELLTSAPYLVELSTQLEKPPGLEQATWNAYLDNLHAPQREVQVCLLALFQQAKGSIPRALRHIQLLEEQAERLRTDIGKCNLQALLDEWNCWYVQVSERLAALEQKRPRQKRREQRLIVQEGARLRTDVQALQRKQDAIIFCAIEAHYALALLECADLTRPYSKRLQELQRLFTEIWKRSRFQRDVAGSRLSLGLSRPLAAPWPQGDPIPLPNRLDQLNQHELLKYFEQAAGEIKKDDGPFALQFLAQATLRFLGPVEETQTNGHQPDLAHLQNEQHPTEHLQALEILLVGAFLATRAGAKLAKMELLLANYRRAVQQFQPEPGLLSQTIQDMEKVVRFVSVQRNIYGYDASSAIPWRVPDELPLAALIAGQPRDAGLEATLRSTNLLRYLETSSGEATDIVQRLDHQSTLAGFPDTLSGEETCYLYLPAGWEGAVFEHALREQVRSTVQVVRTPNIEKMIYLRIHRIHHVAFEHEVT